jgi:hypothetical protein
LRSAKALREGSVKNNPMNILSIIRPLFVFSILFLTSEISSAQVWATAVSRNPGKGTAIVYRYIKELPQNFARSRQPDRVIVVWRYKGKKGMPSFEERKRMDDFEDALSALEKDGFATLAIVSTGDNLREWTYYTRAEDAFMQRLNVALRSKPSFPVEIHTSPDPGWTTYERFVVSVRTES